MGIKELKKCYETVMMHGLDPAKGPFTVRLWDGMDGAWMDLREATNVPLEKALEVWDDRTKGGTQASTFHDIDYYKIFPADTEMHYSGDREMFR
jgi:hypothetical protein